MNLRDKIVEKAESLDWSVTVDENWWGFWKFSPAGEDFGFEVMCNVEDVHSEVKRYADCFDPDEHAEMWIEARGKNGVPSSIRVLIEDADAINEMLEELSNALWEVWESHEEDQDEE